MNTETEKIFNGQIEKPGDIKFDENVVRVFDYMVTRSILFYLEIQQIISEIARDFAKPEMALYDL